MTSRQVVGSEAGAREDKELSVTGWVQSLHSFATYDEDPAKAEKQRWLWDAYVDEAVRDGLRPGGLAGLTLGSVASHIWWRMRRGEPTALPAGLLLILTSASAASFAFAPGDRFPARVHLHIGAGLLFAGLILLRWPRRQPPWSMALMGLAIGPAMLHSMTVAVFERTSDYLIFSGSILAAVGSGALVWFGIGAGPAWLRRRGLEGLAVGPPCSVPETSIGTRPPTALPRPSHAWQQQLRASCWPTPSSGCAGWGNAIATVISPSSPTLTA